MRERERESERVRERERERESESESDLFLKGIVLPLEYFFRSANLSCVFIQISRNF